MRSPQPSYIAASYDTVELVGNARKGKELILLFRDITQCVVIDNVVLCNPHARDISFQKSNIKAIDTRLLSTCFYIILVYNHERFKI